MASAASEAAATALALTATTTATTVAIATTGKHNAIAKPTETYRMLNPSKKMELAIGLEPTTC